MDTAEQSLGGLSLLLGTRETVVMDKCLPVGQLPVCTTELGDQSQAGSTVMVTWSLALDTCLSTAQAYQPASLPSSEMKLWSLPTEPGLLNCGPWKVHPTVPTL